MGLDRERSGALRVGQGLSACREGRQPELREARSLTVAGEPDRDRKETGDETEQDAPATARYST